MTGVGKGIAYVSFPGGGIFMPARSPYDRQMLIEHIADRVRSKGQVQVLIDNQRWMVHLNRGPSADCCEGCGYTRDPACYSPTIGDGAYCVKCAFGAYVDAVAPHEQTMACAAS
ncbi:MAG: hypothetical protein ACHQ4J_05975 [Candidatus Binatia bacterium]